MYLKKIALLNYKNFASEEFEFDKKINCFIGNNGIGKTNVLDAIYHLAFAKGYFNSIAVQNIKHQEDFFLLEGTFQKEEREELISCSLKRGAKKVLKRNGKQYEKISNHIGLIPLVIISPADRNLIIEGSDVRRKFMDGVIAQSDGQYLKDLIGYNKVLAQRNSLLKYFAINHTFDEINLEIYNEQLIELGTIIHKKRALFLNEFIPIFKESYRNIVGEEEAVSLTYRSHLDTAEFEELLSKSLERDRFLQYTSVGVHKDDLIYTIGEHPIKKFGSQGQQKTYLVSLKLAQFDFIKKQTKTTPILLLDDIFDKLDASRVEKLISLVNDDIFGQVFISDTHLERTEDVIKKTQQPYRIFQL